MFLADIHSAPAPPWWGVPAVAGVFTIVGVLLAQASTYLVDRRKAKREDATRWDGEIRQVCVRFLETIREFELGALKFRHAPDETPRPDASPISFAYAELELIAPSAMVEAADDVRFTAVDYGTLNDDSAATALDAVREARKRFVSEVREHMGVGML